VEGSHGHVDIVVNAAGVMLRKPYDETTGQEFEQVMRVNLVGTWLVDREAGRRMTPRRTGKIINISTVYADRVGPTPESAYYASKAGRRQRDTLARSRAWAARYHRQLRRPRRLLPHEDDCGADRAARATRVVHPADNAGTAGRSGS
jgi:NAD(P)-dependent dehydrogenase (short-subunit alcohol dehydrogenase family)